MSTPEFSRKDYQLIALVLGKALAKTASTDEHRAVWQAVLDMNDMFAGDNPRYDPQRFLHAVNEAYEAAGSVWSA